MKSFRVLVVDDHEIFRNGLVDLLKQLPNIAQVLEATDIQEIENLVLENTIDILFMDIEIAPINGIEILYNIKKKCSFLNTIIITNHSYNTYILEAYNSDINAYLLKNTDLNEIRKCIDQLIKGDKYYTPVIAKKLDSLIKRVGSPGTELEFAL